MAKKVQKGCLTHFFFCQVVKNLAFLFQLLNIPEHNILDHFCQLLMYVMYVARCCRM